MTRHRFILPPDKLQPEKMTGEVIFPEVQSHQICKVLRLRPGSLVSVSDGRGGEWQVCLTEVGSRRTIGIIQSYQQKGPDTLTSLTLYQSLLKAAKFELILQKCTELGVHRFVPVETVRCVPSELGVARTERFRSIVREAAEQSGRVTVPVVEQWPELFKDALRSATNEGIAIVLWEDEHMARLRDIPLQQNAASVSLFVGPEGGFSGEEIEVARSCGAYTVSLGSRILRAETAAIVGSALVLAQTGDVG